jgi:hypothetical protein
LYGDFSHSEGLKLREKARKRLKPNAEDDQGAQEEVDAAKAANRERHGETKKGYNSMENALPLSKLRKLERRAKRIDSCSEKSDSTAVHVSFISRPWEACNEDFTSKEPQCKEVFELWENFRNFQVDKLPVQVKILGIWTALCARYGNQICVIGHRSGFVEGAGFIGIPIFYLNDERESLGADSAEQNRLLFDASAVPNPEQDRLRELADVMNTFIPVEAIKKQDVKNQDVKNQDVKNQDVKNQDVKNQDVKKQDVKKQDGFKLSKFIKPSRGKQDTRKSAESHQEPKGEHEKQDDRKSTESYRPPKGVCGKELRAAVFMYMCCHLESGLPAWTARVKMMHHAKAKRWLRERYLFAIDDSEYPQYSRLTTENALSLPAFVNNPSNYPLGPYIFVNC